MLICVVVAFLVCWGPRFVMEFLLKLQLDIFFNPTAYWIRVAIFLLPFIHAVLNPLIYFAFTRGFRDLFVNVARKRPRRQVCSFGLGRVSL